MRAHNPKALETMSDLRMAQRGLATITQAARNAFTPLPPLKED